VSHMNIIALDIASGEFDPGMDRLATSTLMW
jgi:hypothetical protein